jgi:hypothetical protein
MMVRMAMIDVGANNYSPIKMPLNTIKPYQPCGTSKKIGSIARGFKIGVTKMIPVKILGIVGWQRNYYEYIIRDEKNLDLIRKYIQENPVNWWNDTENIGAIIFYNGGENI